MQRLDASHASRTLLVRHQQRTLALVQREIKRHRDKSNKLSNDLIQERKRVAFLTESRARALALLVRYAGDGNSEAALEALNESTMDRQPPRPDNHSGEIRNPISIVKNAQDTSEEAVDESMVSFASDIHNDCALMELTREQLLDMVQVSQRNSRADQAASMRVVQAMKDEVSSLRVEITCLEKRLNSVNIAYASLQRSCLELEYEYNEGAKSLVHTMESNRVESHNKVTALSSKLRSLHLERHGQA